MVPPHAYLQQLARAYRFRDRYAARISAKNGLNDSFNDLEDFLWAAFQNSWHVKDWLLHDNSVDPARARKVVTEAHHAKALMIVQDMANGTKHFVTKKEARDAAISFHTEMDGTTSTHHVIELADGTRLRAIVVLDNALKEWADILKANGLYYFTETPPESFP